MKFRTLIVIALLVFMGFYYAPKISALSIPLTASEASETKPCSEEEHFNADDYIVFEDALAQMTPPEHKMNVRTSYQYETPILQKQTPPPKVSF